MYRHSEWEWENAKRLKDIIIIIIIKTQFSYVSSDITVNNNKDLFGSFIKSILCVYWHPVEIHPPPASTIHMPHSIVRTHRTLFAVCVRFCVWPSPTQKKATSIDFSLWKKMDFRLFFVLQLWLCSTLGCRECRKCWYFPIRGAFFSQQIPNIGGNLFTHTQHGREWTLNSESDEKWLKRSASFLLHPFSITCNTRSNAC